jgi:MFS family permease
MQMVSPELIADLCGLSLGLLLAGVVVGFVLWLFGWKSHRFWVVLLATIAAGVYGLQEAAVFKTSPLVAALLLAVAAGILALALLRLFAFGAGGLTGLIVVQAAAPTLDQPLIVFIVSGLVSLILFRWFLMALTSVGGAVLLCHAGLALFHQSGTFDAAGWAEQSAALLSWICLLAALTGFVFQFLMNRRAARRRDDEEEEGGSVLFRIGRFYRRAG